MLLAPSAWQNLTQMPVTAVWERCLQHDPLPSSGRLFPIRAQNTANKLCEFCVFPCFLNVLIGVYGVAIIQKWLIIDSWSIPLLFRWILELRKFRHFWTCSGPLNPVFLMNLVQKIQETYGNILEKYGFGISENLRIAFFRKSCVPYFSIFEISKFEDSKIWRSDFFIIENDEFMQIMKSRRRGISWL